MNELRSNISHKFVNFHYEPCPKLKGVLRILIFAGCLISVKVSIMLVIKLYKLMGEGVLNQVPGASHQWVWLILGGASLSTTFGIFIAVFNEHQKALKISLLLNCLFIILMGALCLAGSFVGPIERENKDFFESMRNQQLIYNWTATKPDDIRQQESNLSWDILQKANLCCGIEGSSDWNQFRPKELPLGTYPKTCCDPRDRHLAPGPLINVTICSEGPTIYAEGCQSSIAQFQRRLFYYDVFLSIAHLVLFLFAYLLATAILGE